LSSQIVRKCRQWPQIARCPKTPTKRYIGFMATHGICKITNGWVHQDSGFSTTTASDLKFPQVSIARKTISRRSRHSPNAADSTCPADLRAKRAGIEPAHSYAGWPVSGALEQIGDRVSSVWVDAFKPDNGQKAIDVVNEAIRKAALSAVDKGEPGLPAAPAALFLVNEKDRTYVDSKLTPQPVGTYLQAIKLSGSRDKVAKKTYIRAARFKAPAFDKALAECKAGQFVEHGRKHHLRSRHYD